MIPQLPFDDFALVLYTMSTTVMALFFVAVTAVNVLGILVADIIIDKKLKITNPDGEFSWKEVGLIALSSAIVTMGILALYAQDFWSAMFLAWTMGLVFRPLLPEIAKLATDKIKALIEAMFGKYA